jgi:GR25 family glycosyltransferase involved in LPS biosynthesis
MSLETILTCPTYVINLDRRPDRWNDFLKQPTLNQFSNLQRFSAVDGSKLDLMADENISIHTRQNILRKARRSHYEICTPGAIGASYSHISLWKKLIESDSNYIVVFEDDTMITDENLKMIDALIPKLPNDGWDMWLLGTHRGGLKSKPLDPLNAKSWWKVTDFTGAHAYILTKKGAEVLLQAPYPIETHIEYYICACSQVRGLRIIKHWALRMRYFQELTEEDDSDTFDGRKNCPVCYIPDNFPEVGFYMPYWRLYRMMIGLTALGIVGYGAYLGVKKKRTE